MERPCWAVTGAAGFLGSHVVERLLARGMAVAAIDNFSGGRREYLAAAARQPHCRVFELDICDAAAMRAVLEDCRPAAVIHLAAIHFIPACVADPPRTVQCNVHGTQCVLTAARAAGVSRFFFASTGDVYRPAEHPHHEDVSPVEPFNIYGLSKWLGEQLVALEARQRPEAAFVVGRIFNLYGPRETNPHILPEILAQLRSGGNRPLRLGNLWPKRDLVPVGDAAQAVIELVEGATPGLTTVNIATGSAVSMAEVLATFEELLGRRLSVEVDPSKVRPVERPHLQADVGRLRERLGWTPHADLRRGLAELLAAELGL